MKHVLALAPLLLLGVPSMSIAQTIARHGMVVSDSRIASGVGAQVLEKGGNVVDAAVATAFALAVTHPGAGNIGGGGFLVYRDSSDFSTTIDFREKAPIRANPAMFLDSLGKLIPGSNHRGIRSVGVPGTVAGLYLAHRKYGRLDWKTLVQPAIDLAREGFPLPWYLSRDAEGFRASDDAPAFIRAYFNDAAGQPLQFGDTWRQPALAETLERIRDQGHDGFYRGKVAREIDRFMKEQQGLISIEDLRQYEAVERPPARGTYKDYEIISMPPPSSGGVVLTQMLNMFESRARDSVAFNSADYYHLLIEIMRRAYADRAQFLGDPDFNPDLPVALLTSKAHARSRMAGYSEERKSVSDSSRFGTAYESDHTTHISVADGSGNAVSLTYTLEYNYGSRLGSKRLGFIFNNEMGDFNPRPGYTDQRGLIGTPPNQIAAGKRMLSSMTPTIVSRDGELVLVIGSPGGRTIINTVFQTVLGVIEYGLTVEQAIEAPKIHHGWLPDYVRYERDKLSPDTRALLEARGHDLRPVSGALGVLMGIQYLGGSKVLVGACDSDSQEGAAVGY